MLVHVRVNFVVPFVAARIAVLLNLKFNGTMTAVTGTQRGRLGRCFRDTYSQCRTKEPE